MNASHIKCRDSKHAGKRRIVALTHDPGYTVFWPVSHKRNGVWRSQRSMSYNRKQLEIERVISSGTVCVRACVFGFVSLVIDHLPVQLICSRPSNRDPLHRVEDKRLLREGY